MLQQRLNKLDVSVVTDDRFALLNRSEGSACNLFQGTGAKADDQQLSLFLHSFSPVHM
ncbi:hypothetical protein D3C74_416860 [compost metagenome]